MAGESNELVGRIKRISSRLLEEENPAAETVVPRLAKIRQFIESGGVLGPEEFRFINFYDRDILPSCRFLSPLWECRIGLMEFCKHRSEWEEGGCTCEKYQGRSK